MPSEVNVAAIRKDTPNRKAAQMFVNFLLSEEGQNLVARNLGWIPVRSDLKDYALADGKLLSEIQLISRDVKWVTENKPFVLEKFAEIWD